MSSSSSPDGPLDPWIDITVLGAGGLMGSALCKRLARCARVDSITAWNRTFDRLDPDGSLLACGAVTLTPNLFDAVMEYARVGYCEEGGEVEGAGDGRRRRRSIRLVMALVTDGDALMEVLRTLKSRDILHDIILVQMSTISVQHATEAAALVRNGGGRYVDAPVLGSVPQIEDGKLQVFVSGVEEEYFRVNVWPVLRSVASEYFYAGPEVGQSIALKLAVNQLIPSLTSAFSVSFGMCERAGVDPDLLLRIIEQSSLRSPQFVKKYPNMKSREFSRPNFTVQNMLKDIRLIAEQAESIGVESATIRALESLYQKACEQGDGLLDYSAIFSTIHPPDSEKKSEEK